MGLRARDEEGATLVLAVVFIFIVGLLLMSLVSMAGSNIVNTSNLQYDRSLAYAAEAATEAAVQYVRPIGFVPGGLCTGVTTTPPPSPFLIPENGANVSIRVDCGVETGPSPYFRQIKFAACLQSLGVACLTEPSPYVAIASSQAILVGEILYDDRGPGCTSFIPPICKQPGTTVQVLTWNLEDQG